MKFQVNITLTATKTFSYEIDAPGWKKAESEAFDRAMGDFNATGEDATEDGIDFEQLTHECEECGKEYAIPTADKPEAPLAWKEDYEYCAECGAKIEAENQAKQKVGTL